VRKNTSNPFAKRWSDNVCASAKNKAESKAENKAENKAEDLSKGNLSESSDVASAERSGCMNVLILLCKIVFFWCAGFLFSHFGSRCSRIRICRYQAHAVEIAVH